MLLCHKVDDIMIDIIGVNNIWLDEKIDYNLNGLIIYCHVTLCHDYVNHYVHIIWL